MPSVDEVREGQLTARIAGQNAQLSDVLGAKVDRFGNVIAAPAMPRFLKNGGEVVSNPYVRHFAAGGTPMTQEEYQTYLRANPGFPEEQVRQDLIYQGKVPPPLPSAAPASSATPAPALTVEQLYRQYAGREADPGGLEYWTKDFGSDIDAREVDVFKAAVAAARAQGTEPAAPTVVPAAAPTSYTGDISIALPKGPTAFGQNTTPSTPGIGSTPTRPVMPPTFRPPTKPLLPTALAPTIGPNAFENEVLMRGPAHTMERDTSDIPITLAKGPTSGPKLLKEGGEVASNSQLITDYIQQKNKEEQSDVIDTNPLGTAQELLSSVTKINSKAAPIRQSVKRVSRGAGSDASRSKEMNLKVAPLSKSKQMVLDTSSTPAEEKDGAKGSAREQMDDLVRAYELQLKAVKNKARGLSADTFGAPTLEGATLAKNTLAKRRFAEGGEVSEPSIFDVSDYSTRASTDMFPDQLGQDDQRDAARHMLAAGIVARKYGPKAAELLGKAHEYTSNPQTFFSLLGIGQPRDDLPYDVHNNRIGAELAARATSQADLERLVKAMALQAQTKQTKDKPYIMSREQMEARKAKAQKGVTERPEYGSKK